MTQEELKKMPMSEVKNFIRQTLSFKNVYPHLSDDIRHMNAEQIAKEHLRFEMSGLDIDSVSRNMNILNRFEYLGIYDCVDCLFLNFRKGTPRVTIQYRYDDECHWYEFPGFTTTEIIYEIFKLTIFSKKNNHPNTTEIPKIPKGSRLGDKFNHQ